MVCNNFGQFTKFPTTLVTMMIFTSSLVEHNQPCRGNLRHSLQLLLVVLFLTLSVREAILSTRYFLSARRSLVSGRTSGSLCFFTFKLSNAGVVTLLCHSASYSCRKTSISSFFFHVHFSQSLAAYNDCRSFDFVATMHSCSRSLESFT